MTPAGRIATLRPTARASSPVAAMLRGGLGYGVVLGVVTAVISAVVWGMSAVGSAVAASAITMVFFIIGMLGMKFVLGGAAGLSLVGAFVVYFGQLILLAFAIVAFSRADWVQGKPFAVAAITQAVAWQIGMFVGFSRARIPVVEGVDR